MSPGAAVRLLAFTGWGDPRPLPMYVDWVYAAGYHPEQNTVWHEHELYGREHYASDEATWCDLGGES